MSETNVRRASAGRWGAWICIGLLLGLGGCGLDEVEIPELDGPSELALSVRLTASPDILVADGFSTSLIQATLRGPNGEVLAQSPDDPQRTLFQGLALAYQGRQADALAKGEHALSLISPEGDYVNGPYFQHVMARIYLLVGERDKALDLLEAILKRPYFVSPGWLRIDPTFAELKGHPRFERLLQGP